MNKEQLFQELQNQLASGQITREEVNQLFGLNTVSSMMNEEAVGTSSKEKKHHFSVTKMLYVIGAGIVLIGIMFFVAQIWDDMGSFARIVITLGLGILASAMGSMLYKDESKAKLGVVFHAIGGLLIPGGAVVLLDELKLDSDWGFAFTFVFIFIFYFLLNSVHRHAVLTFFTIANGTAAIYFVANALLGPVLGYRAMETFYEYLTMALGASYLFFSHSFQGTWNQKLIRSLQFFGITGFLWAAFLKVFDSGLWELFYFILVFGGLLLSVYMRSQIILVMSTIFLLVHVTYITAEYFADSLGWPIALILLGFIFIGLGYASISINNKYLKKEAQPLAQQ